LKINKKKFVYLISPNKIYRSFYKDLVSLFKIKKISFFQLRLKKTRRGNKLIIGRKIKKICKKYKVKFIVNDDPFLAKKLDADGCHLGQKDKSVSLARKILKNKIIGITCHNSIKLVKKELRSKPDYIALGAFYVTKTKKAKYKAKLGIIKSVKKISNLPIVAIGGIKFENYKKVLLNKADFLAISGYIWNNNKLNPLNALKKLK
tara:strand:- start:42 stop:656 length:615 start_codon:yes stop_codon:yes gene_type:complete